MALNFGVRGDRIAAINITPLADVMIVLLIIFMVSTPLISHGRVRKPPFSETARAKRDSSLNVAIAADATTYLNEIPVPSSNDLRDLLRSALATASRDAIVYVKAEGALPYGTVARVVDTCREAGAKEIALIVDARGTGAQQWNAP